MHLLLNWLAHGAMIWAAAAAALRMIPRSRTQARYRFLWTATAALVVLPVLSMAIEALTPPPVDDHLVRAASSAALPVLTIPGAWWTSTTFVLALWLAWMVAYATRIGMDAVALRRARRECRECPAEILARLDSWGRLKNMGRGTRVVLSHDVRAAGVLGFGSPIIALSPALLHELGEDDMDRVVVHEWAHVQRYDDVAKCVQALVQLVAGWHPAVRWLERQMEVEREVACDEMAVAATGSAKAYAACLTTLATRFAVPARPLAALGAISASGLRQRIVRILAGPNEVSTRRGRAATIAASTSVLVLAVGIVNLPFADTARAAVRTSTDVRLIAAAATSAAVTAFSPVEFGTPSVSRSVVPSSERSADERPDQAPIATDVPGESTRQTLFTPVMPTHTELPGTSVPVARSAIGAPSLLDVSRSDRSSIAGPLAERPVNEEDEVRAPWTAAVTAGIAIGRGSQNASVATGRAFTRFGKRVAGSF